jgi:hypothetical protein
MHTHGAIVMDLVNLVLPVAFIVQCVLRVVSLEVALGIISTKLLKVAMFHTAAMHKREVKQVWVLW